MKLESVFSPQRRMSRLSSWSRVDATNPRVVVGDSTAGDGRATRNGTISVLGTIRHEGVTA